MTWHKCNVANFVVKWPKVVTFEKPCKSALFNAAVGTKTLHCVELQETEKKILSPWLRTILHISFCHATSWEGMQQRKKKSCKPAGIARSLSKAYSVFLLLSCCSYLSFHVYVLFSPLFFTTFFLPGFSFARIAATGKCWNVINSGRLESFKTISCVIQSQFLHRVLNTCEMG